MTNEVLADTHVVINWLAEPKRLSRDQMRIMEEIEQRRQAVALSAITPLEIALLFSSGNLRSRLTIHEVFDQLETDPLFRLLPLTIDIAREAYSLRNTLRDPSDRVIVATARVHGLRLLTSDRRIIESNVVSTVE